MYKIVKHRREKKELDAELGLTDDVKELLGYNNNDTDSDESRSDSDSDSDSDDDGPSADEAEGPVVEEASDDEEEEGPFMPIGDALAQPLQPHPERPGLVICVVCPGKTLKEGRMAEVHEESASHNRRLERLKLYITEASSTPEGLVSENVYHILRIMDEERAAPPITPSPRKPKAPRQQKAAEGETPKGPSRRERRAAQQAAAGTTDAPKPVYPPAPAKRKRRRESKGKPTGPAAAEPAAETRIPASTFPALKPPKHKKRRVEASG